MRATPSPELLFSGLPSTTEAEDGVERSGGLWGDSRRLLRRLLGPTVCKGATLTPCRTLLRFTAS